MKQCLSLVLLLALALLLIGCGSAPAAPAPTALPETPEPVATEAPAEEPEPESAPLPVTTEAAAEEPLSEAAADGRVLVVYFSGTGRTRGVAEKIASLTGAELLEILPAQPYTTEDLNYNDSTTRATVEQNTPDARPEIANEISLDGCTTLYLGYPIWWGQAPRILSSFVESHDFTGMTVIPFCTSGSSGAGRTGETLGEQAGTGTFLSATRFDASVTEAELQTWIDGHS